MKKFLLAVTVLLVFSACKKEDTTPKTRTVFFGTATLDNNGREVRVMFDTLNTRHIDILIPHELQVELGLQTIWANPEAIEQQRDWYPFYDVMIDRGCVPCIFQLAGLQCGGVDYRGGCGPVIDFSRQERMTGQHIDIVIGWDAARRLFSQDFQPYWADMKGGDGRSLLDFHTDLRMVVPYDWGMSEE